MKKRANKGRRDENEPEVVAALQAVGAKVIKLAAGGLVDLLVGYRGVNFLIEVKNPKVKRHEGAPTKAERSADGAYAGCLPTMSRKQFDAIRAWPGHAVAIVQTAQEALVAIGVCPQCLECPQFGHSDELRSGLCVDCEMIKARGY